LLFGLQALIDAIPNGFRLAVAHVDALAKVIVRHMVHLRREMLRLVENARRRRLEASIILKLGDGALWARDLLTKAALNIGFALAATCPRSPRMFSGRTAGGGALAWPRGDPADF